MTTQPPHIGTLRETPLHASLKAWSAQDGDRFEMPVDGYVIDILRGEQLVEIQTRGFSSMRRKVAALLNAGHQLRIVHPVARERWIIKIEDEGTIVSRRRSPRKGTPLDLFAELTSMPTAMQEDGFEIDLVMITEEEIRHHTPGKAWRRRGWGTLERRLVEVHESVELRTPEDLLTLLPHELSDTFTTADIASAAGVPRRIAQQTAYCLRNLDLVTAVGKSGNAIQYRLAD